VALAEMFAILPQRPLAPGPWQWINLSLMGAMVYLLWQRSQLDQQELLARFVAGEAEEADRQRLEELCAMVRATSLCGLGQSAPNPVLSTLRWFRHEYEAACREPADAVATGRVR
jgi:hypothetical protein